MAQILYLLFSVSDEKCDITSTLLCSAQRTLCCVCVSEWEDLDVCRNTRTMPSSDSECFHVDKTEETLLY